MTGTTKPAEATAPTAESIAKDHPAVAAHFRAEGETAERERILGVEKQGLPGYEALIAECKADGKTTPAQAAEKIVAAQRAKAGGALSAMQSELGKPVVAAPSPAPSAPSAQEDETLPIEQRAKAAWDTDPKVRTEFRGDYASYEAFRKAESQGRVRILSKVA